MRSAPAPHILLAAALSLAAGYIDAIGYLNSGGFFLSFMSGNSTRLGIGIGGMLVPQAAIAGGIIGLFVLGVFIGTLIAHRAEASRLFPILLLETALLAVAALLETVHHPIPGLGAAVLAMGLMNTIFQRNGEVSIGLTYMTGTLVKIGQHLASSLIGGPAFAWLPYAVLWASLVSGAIGGTIADHLIGLRALWLAAFYLGGVTLITAIAWRRGFRV